MVLVKPILQKFRIAVLTICAQFVVGRSRKPWFRREPLREAPAAFVETDAAQKHGLQLAAHSWTGGRMEARNNGKKFMDHHVGSVSSTKTMYAVGVNNQIYEQAITDMTASTTWQKISDGPSTTDGTGATSIAIKDDTIYALALDGAIYDHSLSTLSYNAPWVKVAKGPVKSILIIVDDLYAVGNGTGVDNSPKDGAIYKQSVIDLDPDGDWTQVGGGQGAEKMVSIATTGSQIYGVGEDGVIYQQMFSTMAPDTSWTAVGSSAADRMLAIAIDDPTTIWATDQLKVLKADVGAIPTGPGGWTEIGQGPILSMVISGTLSPDPANPAAPGV